jgi:predicted ester cyclase
MRQIGLTLLLFSMSMGGWAEQTVTAEVLSPTVSANESVLNNYYGALNQGDIEGAVSFLDESFTSDAALPGLKKGREGFEASLKALRLAFPDLSFEILERVSQGDTTVVRYDVVGTQRGKLYGIKATRKKIKVTGIDIWKFQNGKILGQHGNFDALGMLVQLGIAPELK